MHQSIRERSHEHNEVGKNAQEKISQSESNNSYSSAQSSSKTIDGVDVNAALQAAMANAVKISATRIILMLFIHL